MLYLLHCNFPYPSKASSCFTPSSAEMRDLPWRGHQARSAEVHSDWLSKVLSYGSQFLFILSIFQPLWYGRVFFCALKDGAGMTWVPAGAEEGQVVVFHGSVVTAQPQCLAGTTDLQMLNKLHINTMEGIQQRTVQCCSGSFNSYNIQNEAEFQKRPTYLYCGLVLMTRVSQRAWQLSFFHWLSS